MPTASRVILAGPTGVEKAHAARKLKAWLERDTRLKNRVGVHDVERALRQSDGGDPRSLAGVRSARAQRERWRRAWTFINREIARAGDMCSIVTLHLVFAQRGHRICPAPLTTLAEWDPNLVVTLIDDVYACKRRIELKNYRFSLSQLYDWRTTEVMLADQVAYISSALQAKSALSTNQPRAHSESLVLSVKHPLRTLGRLILEPSLPRAYASFPITSTRGDRSRREEIDRFRRRMHEVLTTFDPLTIDELPLVTRAGKRARCVTSFHPLRHDGGEERDVADQRWDAGISAERDDDLSPLVGEPEESVDHLGRSQPFYPMAFHESEIEELWREEAGEQTCVAHDHVTIRDVRFVDQADFVVCYRPYRTGRVSTGVGAEIHHANETGKPVYAFVGGDARPAKPLEGFFTQQFTNENDFWAFLEKEAKRTVSLPRPMYF